MELIKFQVGDRVKATANEGVSLVNGESYKIIKISVFVGVDMDLPIYWITGKPTGNVMTMAFNHQLEL